MTRTLARLCALASVTLAAWPHAALACSVCFDSRDQNRVAFIATTALLTLLPLLMVGGSTFWLYRRAQALGKE
jgi:hypothetical protein